ncbi:MAG: hypothetical protein ACSLFK_10525 [Gemmatimonadaceae bacterium]
MDSVALQDLAHLSKGLNDASDALSREIAQIESALAQLKLGVWAWVTVSKYRDASEFRVNGVPDYVTVVESLGYGKHRGKWCLLFSTSYEEYGDPELDTTIPLREAARDERIAAASKLPELLDALRVKAKQTTEEAIAKSGEVAELSAAIQRVLDQ